MRKIRSIVLPVLALAVVATPLVAQSGKSSGSRAPAMAPADIVKNRIAGLRELGAAFKNVNDGLRGEPQMIMIRQSAREIKNASLAIGGWFPAGTGPQPGIKTLAKPEIWSKPAEFRAAAANFGRAADALQAAANSGNANAIRSAFRQVGGTCKGCHDPFRTPPPQT